MGAAGIDNLGAWNSLYGNDGRKVALKESIDGETIIEGTLYQRFVKNQRSGEFSEFYNIETAIVWKNPNNLFNSRPNNDTLVFKTHQIKFNIANL